MERGEEGNRNDKDHFIETQIQEVSTNINNFVPTCDLKHVCMYNVRRYTWSTRHVLSIVDIEGKFAFILKPFRRMLLRFWKASLGPTQAGRRGCWHLYPPQPGLAGLTSDYGWQFFRFSAAGSKPQSAAAACRAIYQRRTMAANPPQYFARPFTARPRFAARGRGRPRLIVRGCCIHCFVETWSLGHSNTQHYSTHSVVFVRLLMSQPGHNRRHGNLACSQPIFSFSFSLSSFTVSII